MMSAICGEGDSPLPASLRDALLTRSTVLFQPVILVR